MKVENKNAHRAADKHYFFATHVRDGDGSGDDVVMLLLTDKELERAAKRATKNKEDLPKHFAIIQGKTEDETILLDDTDVAEPKKSTGLFGWLMGD
jgi:hypothetical protein